MDDTSEERARIHATATEHDFKVMRIWIDHILTTLYENDKTSEGDKWAVLTEIHGRDHYSLKRYKVIRGAGEKLGQAVEQVLAEISFTKLGGEGDGTEGEAVQ